MHGAGWLCARSTVVARRKPEEILTKALKQNARDVPEQVIRKRLTNPY
jgi:hypothetical protein